MLGRLLSNRGFSLVQTLIAAGVMGVVALGTISISNVGMKASTEQQVKDAANLIHDNLIAYIEDNNGWANTYADTTNASMACLRNGTTCSALNGVYSTFRLRDAANTLVYDPLSSATNGFSLGGANGWATCSTYNAAAGNNSCPFRVALEWTPICAGSCIAPPITIRATFSYKAATGTNMEKIVVNANRYSFTFTRGYRSNTLEAACTMLGGTFTAPSTCTGVGASSVWSTNGTAAYYNAGKVGIGVSAPSSTLQIGTYMTLPTVANPSLFGWNVYHDGTVWKYINAEGAAAIRMHGFDGTYGAGGGGISFHTSADGAAAGTVTNMDGSDIRMLIQPAGNVGIGITNPSQKLHVSGVVTATGYLGGGYCGVTASTYDGAGVAGWSGAATKCRATAGCNSTTAHMCSFHEIAKWMQDTGSAGPSGANYWLSDTYYGDGVSVDACTNWSTNSSAVYGATTRATAHTAATYNGCNGSNRIACCN